MAFWTVALPAQASVVVAIGDASTCWFRLLALRRVVVRAVVVTGPAGVLVVLVACVIALSPVSSLPEPESSPSPPSA
ncbi:hypothetical protein SCALM49S_02478 [Streptomyces californicus]